MESSRVSMLKRMSTGLKRTLSLRSQKTQKTVFTTKPKSLLSMSGSSVDTVILPITEAGVKETEFKHFRADSGYAGSLSSSTSTVSKCSRSGEEQLQIATPPQFDFDKDVSGIIEAIEAIDASPQVSEWDRDHVQVIETRLSHTTSEKFSGTIFKPGEEILILPSSPDHASTRSPIANAGKIPYPEIKVMYTKNTRYPGLDFDNPPSFLEYYLDDDAVTQPNEMVHLPSLTQKQVVRYINFVLLKSESCKLMDERKVWELAATWEGGDGLRLSLMTEEEIFRGFGFEGKRWLVADKFWKAAVRDVFKRCHETVGWEDRMQILVEEYGIAHLSSAPVMKTLRRSE
jgi:hypothetical protein